MNVASIDDAGPSCSGRHEFTTSARTNSGERYVIESSVRHAVVKTCMLCPNTLEGELLAEEHVIPQAIGGRKSVRDFICRPCNSKLGKDWEAALAEQFLWFSTMAGVRRERGDHPDLSVTTSDGRKLRIHADGTSSIEGFSISEIPQGDRTKISIRTGDRKTTKNLLKKVAKKHPSVDVEQAIRSTQNSWSYLDSTLRMDLTFSGPKSGRSVVKSALALASQAGVRTEECERALHYLLDEQAGAPFGLCYYADLVVDRPPASLFHCVSVIGQPVRRRILAYVEYFNFARFLVHVGDGYSGEPFQITYAIDPVQGTDLDVTIDFARIDAVLDETLKSCGEPIDKFVQAINDAGSIVQFLADEREMKRAIEAAVSEALKEPRWPVQIPPSVATSNSPRQGRRDYEGSVLMARRLAASLRR